MTDEVFKIGDNVILLQTLYTPNFSYGKIKKGSVGTVCRIAKTGAIGVSFFNYTGGHDCNNSCKDGTGLYINSTVIKKQPKSIEQEFKELYEMT